jgi:hypothetical protein
MDERERSSVQDYNIIKSGLNFLVPSEWYSSG